MRVPGNWRAVYLETCTHGSAGGGRKSTSDGNSSAPYPTTMPKWKSRDLAIRQDGELGKKPSFVKPLCWGCYMPSESYSSNLLRDNNSASAAFWRGFADDSTQA